MKGKFFVICLLFIPFLLPATPVGDLYAKLQKAGTDSSKIAAYRELISYYSQLNIDSSEYYGHGGLKYAIETNYILGEALIYEQLANLDKEQERREITKKRTQKALDLFRKADYLQGVANMINKMGVIEGSEGNYDIAIKYFFSALKVMDTLKDNTGIMTTYLNLGSIYLQHNDSANTFKYLTKAAELGKQLPLSDAAISVYNTLAVAKVAAGDSQAALKMFLDDLELSNKPEFVKSHVECLSFLGRYYLDNGATEKALGYLKEGLKTAEQNKLYELEANLLLEIGQILRSEKRPGAMDYLEKAKAICERTRNRPFLVIIYEEIATLYQEQGNYKAALEATQYKQKIADSIYNRNMMMQVRAIGNQFEIEETNMRMAELEEQSRQHALERNIIIVIAVIIIMTFIIVLFYYRKSTMLNKHLRMRKDELKGLNAMKDKLFSVIGHDLRSPIASIPTVLDIYEDESTGTEEKKFLLDNLKENSKVSLETLDKLLYWGHSLLKGIHIHQMDFNAKPYITEAVSFKRMAAQEKNISITDNTYDNVPIHADPTHFDFVIRNLLANAIKYTGNNGYVEISCDLLVKPGLAVFSVKDNGTGISKEILSKIFSPTDSAAGTANEKGNGIGLTLCKEFVVHNGGEIWVHSVPGKGSTFYFSLKSVA